MKRFVFLLLISFLSIVTEAKAESCEEVVNYFLHQQNLGTYSSPKIVKTSTAIDLETERRRALDQFIDLHPKLRKEHLPLLSSNPTVEEKHAVWEGLNKTKDKENFFVGAEYEGYFHHYFYYDYFKDSKDLGSFTPEFKADGIIENIYHGLHGGGKKLEIINFDKSNKFKVAKSNDKISHVSFKYAGKQYLFYLDKINTKCEVTGAYLDGAQINEYDCDKGIEIKSRFFCSKYIQDHLAKDLKKSQAKELNSRATPSSTGSK